MKAPDLPENEAQRLQVLRSTGLLDTQPDERFDRFTQLAKEIFDVPIVLISLVDRHRQWFKSRQGLETPETSRAVSFCGHAILTDEVFVVPDALEDERFKDNPLVTGEPHVRFYAGCSLGLGDHYNIGTLCLIGTEPREFSQRDRRILKHLAEMLQHEIELLKQSTLDHLTQLYNDQGFEMVASQTLAMCSREELPATLIYIRLNNFHQICDRFGDDEGKRALNDFGQLLSGVLRKTDVTGRLDWDSFGLLMAGASIPQAQSAVDSVRMLLNEFNLLSENSYKLDFQYGYADFSPGMEIHISELVEIARGKSDSTLADTSSVPQN